MTIDIGIAEQVGVIADDFFTAMITGEPGSVHVVPTGTVTLQAPIHAWVDVDGSYAARALLSTEEETAHTIARALLGMALDEPVSEADLIDAFGEMANVVGGNIKSLLPEQGALTMPQVASEPPAIDTPALTEVDLDWDGRGLTIRIWKL